MNWFLKMLSGRGISFTKTISWPDASLDKCVKCEVVRKDHGSQLHIFEEEQ